MRAYARRAGPSTHLRPQPLLFLCATALFPCAPTPFSPGVFNTFVTESVAGPPVGGASYIAKLPAQQLRLARRAQKMVHPARATRRSARARRAAPAAAASAAARPPTAASCSRERSCAAVASAPTSRPAGAGRDWFDGGATAGVGGGRLSERRGRNGARRGAQNRRRGWPTPPASSRSSAARAALFLRRCCPRTPPRRPAPSTVRQRRGRRRRRRAAASRSYRRSTTADGAADLHRLDNAEKTMRRKRCRQARADPAGGVDEGEGGA